MDPVDSDVLYAGIGRIFGDPQNGIYKSFRGLAVGREGQPLAWCAPSELAHYDFPAANQPIVEACLQL